MESGSIIRANAKGARHWAEKFPEFPEEQRRLNVERNRLHIEGGHLIDAIVSDLLGKFTLGPLYAMLLRREGQKMMKATEKRTGNKDAFIVQSTALKAGFLAALAPAPAVMPAAYDELISRVFAQVLPLLTIEAGSTSVPS